jgi:poly(beta-D-mannuronate) lyase
MRNGVWTNTVINFNATGAYLEPITLRAEVDGQVRLEGTSRLVLSGNHLVVRGLHFTNGSLGGGNIIEFRGSGNNANYCRLTECAITDYNPADPTTNYKWVSVYGFYNRIDHCSFTGMNHIGVTLTVWLKDLGGQPNATRIDNNIFSDRAQGWDNGFETIRIGTSEFSMQDADSVVESNYFYRCDGEIEIISNKSGGNIYSRNTFEECKGQLTLRHGNDCLVEGNFFLGNGVADTSGVRIIGEDHTVVNNSFEYLRGEDNWAALPMMNGVPDSPLNRYFQVQRALIAFNTFVDCKENFVVGYVSSVGDNTMAPIDCTIANNVVQQGTHEPPLIEYISEPTNMVYEGNIFYGASLGIPQPSGINVLNPYLERADDGLMRPAAYSPVIDAAEGSYTSILSDMDGDARVAGSQDIGADEVTSGSPPFTPVGRDDVGPRWMRPSTLNIRALDISSSTADITFEDTTGLAPSYDLERTDNLETGVWTRVATLIPVAHTSSVFRIADSMTNGPTAFWRVSCD